MSDHPWYVNYETFIAQSREIHTTIAQFMKSEPAQKEYRNFYELCLIRLIYESDTIEGEGMKSYGQTEKVIKENFPRFEDGHSNFSAILNGKTFIQAFKHRETVKKMMDAVVSNGLKLDQVMPTMQFSKKSKLIRAVMQHYQAYNEGARAALLGIFSILSDHLSEIENKRKPNSEKSKSLFSEFVEGLNEKDIDVKNYNSFSTSVIKKIHKTMCHDLLLKSNGILPGEYRNDSRSITGDDVILPGPEIIAPCMEKWASDSNKLIKDNLTNFNMAFEIAAKVSHSFVRIHPFPDFNGRMSRIIMNMALFHFGVNVPICLKSNGKEKRRYFYSLRHANKGNIKPYAALIAKRYVETGNEYIENIKMSGLLLPPPEIKSNN